MPEVGMLGTNPLLGAGVSLVASTTARTPEDLSQTIQDMLNSIGEQPIPFAVRMAVTLAIVAMALFGGRWLAGLAGRVPVGVDLKLGRADRLNSGDVRSEEHT